LVLKADPKVLPQGHHTTDISVRVENVDPDDPRTVVTTLSAPSGTFGDVHAWDTTYTCDPRTRDVEICVEAQLENADDAAHRSENVQVGSSSEYLGGPHIRDRPECSPTRCIQVLCPGGGCPEYQQILIHPTTQSLGNLIDVTTWLVDVESDTVKVHVESNCGTVADPVQTGDGFTTVACDILGTCWITIELSDDRARSCARSSFTVYCQPEED
jgi:hypothetical protein